MKKRLTPFVAFNDLLLVTLTASVDSSLFLILPMDEATCDDSFYNRELTILPTAGNIFPGGCYINNGNIASYLWLLPIFHQH